MNRRPVPPHGTNARRKRGCSCDACKLAAYRYVKTYRVRAARAGGHLRVPAGKVVAHVNDLLQHTTRRGVAVAAGLNDTRLGRLLSGEQKTIHKDVAARILAVTLDDIGDRHYVSARPTIRRLQALVCLGYTLAELARKVDANETHIQRLAGVGMYDGVHRDLDQRVRALYDDLCMTVPQPTDRYDKARAANARTLAKKRGWHPPLAWDDIDTDPNPAMVTPVRLHRPKDDIDEAVVLRRCAGETTPEHPTRAEREEIVRRLHAQGRNDRQIGDTAGMPHETAQRIRSDLGLPPNLEAGQEVRRSA